MEESRLLKLIQKHRWIHVLGFCMIFGLSACQGQREYTKTKLNDTLQTQSSGQPIENIGSESSIYIEDEAYKALTAEIDELLNNSDFDIAEGESIRSELHAEDQIDQALVSEIRENIKVYSTL